MKKPKPWLRCYPIQVFPYPFSHGCYRCHQFVVLHLLQCRGISSSLIPLSLFIISPQETRYRLDDLFCSEIFVSVIVLILQRFWVFIVFFYVHYGFFQINDEGVPNLLPDLGFWSSTYFRFFVIYRASDWGGSDLWPRTKGFGSLLVDLGFCFSFCLEVLSKSLGLLIEEAIRVLD